MKYVNEESIIYFSIPYYNDQLKININLDFFSKSDRMTPVFDIHVPINKEKHDALKRWSNADFRFNDTSVCLTIDFLRIKLKQIRDFPLFSRLDVLKTVKIGKIVFTYPFYSSFVFYSKSLFEPWFNINIRFHTLFPLSSKYVEWIEKGVKVWRNKSNVDYL